MEDLFKAGYKKDDILDALRILPFVCPLSRVELIPAPRYETCCSWLEEAIARHDFPLSLELQ